MRTLAMVFGACSTFFVFNTWQVLSVTSFLRQVPPGENAYRDAIAFAILALAFDWVSWRCWRSGTRKPARSIEWSAPGDQPAPPTA